MGVFAAALNPIRSTSSVHMGRWSLHPSYAETGAWTRKLTHSRYGYPVPTLGGLAEGVDACFKLCPTHAGGNMESLASKTDQHHRHLVNRERFRSVMGHFASGVTIITTRHEGIDYGLTA